MNQYFFEKQDFGTFERFSCETSPEHGSKPAERVLKNYLDYGIINLDKPKGPTSHQVTKWVSKILGVRKTGHGGTLDPNVTGVLPIGLNKSTRIMNVFLLGGKEYVCEMRVHADFKKKDLLKTIKGFEGIIDQLPPIKSSVKREWRKRTIYYIRVLEIVGRKVLFRVGCEAGTYIRKLCTDIGKKLGTGAHMQYLRRTKASCFNEDENLVSLHDLQEAMTFYHEKGDESLLRNYVLPVEKAVMHLRKVWVSDSAASAVCHGAQLMLPGVCSVNKGINKDDVVAIMSLKNELVGTGTALMTSQEMKERVKGQCVKTNAVIMSVDAYPKKWRDK